MRRAVTLKFIQPGLELRVELVRSRLLDRRKVEFSGLCHAGGLDAPTSVILAYGKFSCVFAI